MLATRSFAPPKLAGKKASPKAVPKTPPGPAAKAKEAPKGLPATPPMPPDQERPGDYPIPKGDNPYSIAKRFEYIHKNLPEAEKYYRVAIAQRVRVESAVKDLAGVLHQQGRTQEACDLLESHKRLFVDSQAKFDNLLQSLKTQSRNASYKYLKLWGLSETATEDIVRTMFSNPNRIHAVFLMKEGRSQTAVLQFLSLSAARKTVEGFRYPSRYRLESVSLPVEMSDDPVPAAFEYSLFDPQVHSVSPADKAKEDGEIDGWEEGAAHYLGSALYRSICLES